MGRSLASYHIDNELVGAFIKKHMEIVGKSQRQVATECGVSEDQVSRICRGGAQNLNFEFLVKLAVCCEFSICDLLQSVVSPDEVDFKIVVKTGEHIIAAKNTDHSAKNSENFASSLQTLDHHYEKMIDKLVKSHEETEKVLLEQNKRLRRTAWIMFGLFMAETLAILGLFAYDAMHPDRGWLQYMASLLKNRNSTDYIMRG